METTNKWLLAILVLLPTYLIRFSLFGIPLNFLDLVITLGFVYCVVHYHGLRTTRSFKIIAASFLAIGLIALLVSGNKIDALGVYKSYIIMPVLMGAMLQTVRPKLQHVLMALGSGVVFISVIALVQWISGYGIPSPWNVGGLDVRMTSVFEYPNAVGLFCAPVIALAVAWLIHERSHKLWFVAVAVLGILAIGLSVSEGAIVAVAAAVGFALLFTRYKYPTIIVGLLLVLLVLLIPSTREIVLLHNTSGEVRLALWEGTVNLLQDHPFFGAGLGNFPNIYADYKLDRHVELLLYPHNILLDFWVEFGLPGLVWLLAVVVYFFKRGLQSAHRHQAVVLMSGMVAMLVYGLVDVPYFKNDLSVIFWMLLALIDLYSPRHTSPSPSLD